MDENQLRGILGLSMVSKNAVCGEGPCLKCLRSGQCELLLVDADASTNTKAMYKNACDYRSVPLAFLPGGFLRQALGRDCMAMAMKKSGLTVKVRSLLEDQIVNPALKREEKLTDRNVGGVNVV